jgi:hypothetical protein
MIKQFQGPFTTNSLLNSSYDFSIIGISKSQFQFEVFAEFERKAPFGNFNLISLLFSNSFFLSKNALINNFVLHSDFNILFSSKSLSSQLVKLMSFQRLAKVDSIDQINIHFAFSHLFSNIDQV